MHRSLFVERSLAMLSRVRMNRPSSSILRSFDCRHHPLDRLFIPRWSSSFSPPSSNHNLNDWESPLRHFHFPSPHSSSSISVRLSQRVDGPSLESLGTGALAWDCTERMANYLAKYFLSLLSINKQNTDNDSVEDRYIVELGAGTGLIGITAHRCLQNSHSIKKSHIILTDQPPLLPLLQENISMNDDQKNKNDHRMEALSLHWEKESDFRALMDRMNHRSPDLIICCELLYVWDGISTEKALENILRLFYSTHPNHSSQDHRSSSSSIREQRILFAFEERGPLTASEGFKSFFDSISRIGYQIERLYDQQLFPLKDSIYCLYLFRAR